MAAATRLLIVDLLNRDRVRQDHSELFPAVRAFARERGVDVCSLAIGYEPGRAPDGRFRVALTDADAAALLDRAEELAPTHVLLNEPLTGALEKGLRERAPRATFALHRQGDGPNFRRVRALTDWLDMEDPDDPELALLDAVVPDHDCELVGDLARTIRPYVLVPCGPLCYYAAPIGKNPRFADVDLSGLARTRGCTFCGGVSGGRYPLRTPVEKLVARHCAAAYATCPPERYSGEFLLLGSSAFLRLRPVMEAVLALDLPGAAFHFFCRIDEIRRRADDIDALLPRLHAHGHSIHLFAMGVENFAPEENERFNKGISVEDLTTTHAHLQRWEDGPWGTSLRFRRYGGYSFILFTPWTRLADLRVNLEGARRFGLAPTPSLLSSRLQLFEDRPITRLAERDGLLAEMWRDPVWGRYDSGCEKEESQRELPWLFADGRVAAVYSVLCRLWLDSEEDALARRVTAFRRKAGEGGLFALMRRLLDVAETLPEGSNGLELWQRVLVTRRNG